MSPITIARRVRRSLARDVDAGLVDLDGVIARASGD